MTPFCKRHERSWIRHRRQGALGETMSTDRTLRERFGRWLRICCQILLLLGMMTQSGCELQPPKGVTAFRFEDKREVQSAQLIPPKSDEMRGAIRLKFIDTNLFQTTATLAPGRYGLVVRLGEGQYLRTEIEIVPDRQLYRIPPLTSVGSTPVTSGPRLEGRLYVREGQMPHEVVVLFISHDVVIRRVPVGGDGRFRVEAPAKGSYRVELVAPSAPAWIWSADKLDLSSDVSLDLVVMRRVF